MTLNPTPPALTRLRLRARWTRRRAGYWLARQLRRLERRLDPLPRDPHRALHEPIRNAAGHVTVTPRPPWYPAPGDRP